MWCLRRMERIGWTETMSNETVLQRFGGKRELMMIVQRRKIGYCGHIIRGRKYELPQLALRGKLTGKVSRGRKRRSWMDDIKEWTGLNVEKIVHGCRNKGYWRSLAANLRLGEGT